MKLYTNTVESSTYNLLESLMQLPQIRDFALVDGTNLSLRLGHRLSVDLDLFTNKSFLSIELIPNISSHFPSFELLRSTEKSFSAIINGIKTDMIFHAYDYIDPIIVIDGVRLVSVPDIVAMKLLAIAQRGAKKDFWDIAALLDYYSLDEMIRFFTKKYTNQDYAYIIHSLYYFEDADEQDDPIDLKGVNWKEVKQKIQMAADAFVRNNI